MAMVQATLSTQLQNLAPTDQEATAITNLVNAYGTYAAGAAALTPITAAGVTLGKNAMTAALSGMSAANQGLTKIPNAIIAFWAAVAGGLATSFAGATAIVPPPHATIVAQFPVVCAANTAGNLSLVDSCNAIAALFHANAIVGGTVTTAGPVVTPIL